MAIHNCPDCGLVHEVTVPVQNPEVEIARINAESALAIARLQARTDRHAVETIAEAEQDIAETELETAVAEAEVVGAAIEAGMEPPEAEPIVITDPAPAEPEEDPLDMPDTDEAPSSRGSAKRGLGMWG